jgi:hypothetical protein
LPKIARASRRRFQIPPEDRQRRIDAHRIHAHFSGKVNRRQNRILRISHARLHQQKQTAGRN